MQVKDAFSEKEREQARAMANNTTINHERDREQWQMTQQLKMRGIESNGHNNCRIE
jgi:hypothetical protein